jgi:hypothetical protein
VLSCNFLGRIGKRRGKKLIDTKLNHWQGFVPHQQEENMVALLRHNKNEIFDPRRRHMHPQNDTRASHAPTFVLDKYEIAPRRLCNHKKIIARSWKCPLISSLNFFIWRVFCSFSMHFNYLIFLYLYKYQSASQLQL